MSLARSLVVVLAGTISGCYAATMPLSVHPTPGARDSAGLSFGAAFAQQSYDSGENSGLELPYAEGVLRKSLGVGQLELRASGLMAYAGYDIELARGGSASVVLASGLGVSYMRDFAVNPGAEDAGRLFLVPSASLVVTLERGVYFAPRAGYGFVSSSEGASSGDTYTLGGVIGYTAKTRPFYYGIELSVLRIADAGDPATLNEPVWIVMPSVAIQLVRD